MATQPAIELVALEERESRQHAILDGEYALSLACLPLCLKPAGHQLEQRESSARQNRERDKRLKQRNAAVSAWNQRRLR